MKTYITFDIGGTDIKYGIIKEDYTFIKKASIPTNASMGANQMIERIIAIIHEAKTMFNLSGVSISSAGVIDPILGKVLHTTGAIKNYDYMPVKKMIEENTKLSVSINNDVNCFALCEATVGAGKNDDNFLTMTIGTGIGGAIILNKALVYGASFAAGEWGRMILPQGVYEEEASISALVKKAQLASEETIHNGKDVFDLYDANNKDILPVVAAFYQTLATGIANLIYTFNPKLIVIGGGISNRGQRFIDELDHQLKLICENAFYNEVTLKLAQYSNDSGLIGALVYFKMQESEGC
ncbi:ROK family protein [Liberiplasma polymorphum]|uniref:ROK family protein n=1 Tax=Liberiplasma polymorphum TaxID=3374570 RepID=UPI003773C2F7